MTLSITLMFGGLALSAIAASAAAMALGASGGVFRRRLTGRGSPARRASGALDLPLGIAPRAAGVLARLGERAGRDARGPQAAGALRRKLVQAGFRQDRSPEILFGIRVCLAAGLGALAILAAVAGELPLLGSAGLVMLSANLGLFGPHLALRALIARRSQAMRDGLPDAIDLLVVAIEAGATVSAALQRMVIEFASLHPVLADEFGLMLDEMQAGASRSHALTRLAGRSANPEVGSLSTLLIQSEAVGASLGRALRVFAEELRKTRYLDAERKAAELPVKMAFPLVFCIFPCLISLIFIPVGLSLMRTFFAG